METKSSNMQILREVEEKRGYLLPYHELFWCLDPSLLQAFDQFYENLTLKTRFLDGKTKELVWLGILMSVCAETGWVHLKRLRTAGATDDEISDTMLLSQIAKGFDVLLFVEEKWGKHLPSIKIMETYDNLIKKLEGFVRLPGKTVALIFVGIYSALGIEQALRFHLLKAREYNLHDEEIAEAMSFVFVPRGANIMTKAAEVLKNLVQGGELKPDSIFSYWVPDNQ